MFTPSESPQFPESVLTAAAHPDPYPYYAALLAYRPIYREHRLNLWVALGAQAVSEVLSSALCRVRPVAEPVPAAIAGAPAGNVFKRLVRMNDGPFHAKAKPAVSACLAGFDLAHLTAVARREAAALARDLISAERNSLDRFNFTLPVQVIAQMTGLPPDIAARCATLTGDFVRCLSPLSSPAEIERSNEAAAALLQVLRDELRRPQHGGLAMHAERLQSLGIDDLDAVLANLIGFMSQTYEATAGLIGNTLLALARDAALCPRAAGDDALLRRMIEEVARYDPPIHNTRRFVAQDGMVAGEAMRAGDQILVVLAAANRDPTHCARAHVFDPDRPDRSSFTFGAGPHACTGQTIAIGITAAGIQALLTHGLDVASLASPVEYRRSVNSRIPLFGGAA
ncbi:cytochrome P450 [Dongia deserti]|uniref:cytochrome P450 n=1 Tax=Dongia deserti TaxID=2268030 RepID=UPI0013C4E261|nr:cytochrome P450 [Dongia deserti]